MTNLAFGAHLGFPLSHIKIMSSRWSLCGLQPSALNKIQLFLIFSKVKLYCSLPIRYVDAVVLDLGRPVCMHLYCISLFLAH